MDSNKEEIRIATSPDRHTFQRNKYIGRMAEDGRTIDNDDHVRKMIEFFDNYKKMDEENLAKPEWRKNNLEWDLRTTPWILDKVVEKSYAQNLYAALCNMRWQRIDVVPILKDEYWSCSWRYAGGIVADMRCEGDYIDWYCSGIAGGDEPDVYNEALDLKRRGYVSEGTVTDEIKEDLKRLGWQPEEWPNDR